MNAARRLAVLASLLALLGACSNAGTTTAAKSAPEGGGRAAGGPAAAGGGTTASRRWYADRLEKLGFHVFPTPVDVGDFSAENLGGGNFRLSATRGKIVLLNFWATWCPPCRAEMPSIQALWNKLKDGSFTIVAVSIDDEFRTIRDFLKTNNYDYPIYYDRSKKLATAFDASSIPTTYLIDKTGRAIAGRKGSLEYDSPELVALVQELATR